MLAVGMAVCGRREQQKSKGSSGLARHHHAHTPDDDEPSIYVSILVDWLAKSIDGFPPHMDRLAMAAKAKFQRPEGGGAPFDFAAAARLREARAKELLAAEEVGKTFTPVSETVMIRLATIPSQNDLPTPNITRRPGTRRARLATRRPSAASISRGRPTWREGGVNRSGSSCCTTRWCRPSNPRA